MNKIKNRLVFLIAIMIVAGSCRSNHYKDHSLTVKEYRKLGMPDYNKIWTRVDYVKAFSALSSVKLYQPMSLPRKHSRKSAKVFRSLINKANLSFVGDTTIPLAQRAMEIQFLPGYLSNLRNLYYDKLNPEQYYNEELIDIYIFQLYIFKNMLDLAGKIMNSEDEDAISLRSGSRAVFNSYYNFTVFLLEEQLKSDVYSESDIERLSDAVAESLQLNKGWFESSDKQKINSLMEGVLEKTTSGIIRDNCRKSLEAFEN